MRPSLFATFCTATLLCGLPLVSNANAEMLWYSTSGKTVVDNVLKACDGRPMPVKINYDTAIKDVPVSGVFTIYATENCNGPEEFGATFRGSFTQNHDDGQVCLGKMTARIGGGAAMKLYWTIEGAPVGKYCGKVGWKFETPLLSPQ